MQLFKFVKFLLLTIVHFSTSVLIAESLRDRIERRKAEMASKNGNQSQAKPEEKVEEKKPEEAPKAPSEVPAPFAEAFSSSTSAPADQTSKSDKPAETQTDPSSTEAKPVESNPAESTTKPEEPKPAASEPSSNSATSTTASPATPPSDKPAESQTTKPSDTPTTVSDSSSSVTASEQKVDSSSKSPGELEKKGESADVEKVSQVSRNWQEDAAARQVSENKAEESLKKMNDFVKDANLKYQSMEDTYKSINSDIKKALERDYGSAGSLSQAKTDFNDYVTEGLKNADEKQKVSLNELGEMIKSIEPSEKTLTETLGEIQKSSESAQNLLMDLQDKVGLIVKNRTKAMVLDNSVDNANTIKDVDEIVVRMADLEKESKTQLDTLSEGQSKLDEIKKAVEEKVVAAQKAADQAGQTIGKIREKIEQITKQKQETVAKEEEALLLKTAKRKGSNSVVATLKSGDSSISTESSPAFIGSILWSFLSNSILGLWDLVLRLFFIKTVQNEQKIQSKQVLKSSEDKPNADSSDKKDDIKKDSASQDQKKDSAVQEAKKDVFIEKKESSESEKVLEKPNQEEVSSKRAGVWRATVNLLADLKSLFGSIIDYLKTIYQGFGQSSKKA